MKVTIEHTGLFQPDIRDMLDKSLKPQLAALERGQIYRLDVFFNENQIYDQHSIDRFPIPEEALPKYLQGEPLAGKEKMYELLSYQLNRVVDFMDEQGISLCYCGITGSMLTAPCALEVELLPEPRFQTELQPEPAEASKGRRKRKKETKPAKVISIMPSMSGFMRNLESLYKRMEEELIVAVGSAGVYKTYKAALGFSRVDQVYRTFKQEFGPIDSFRTAENKVLRKKLLEKLDEACGEERKPLEETAATRALDQEGVQAQTSSGREGVQAQTSSGREGVQAQTSSGQEYKLTQICSMPVHKLTKSGRRGRSCVGYMDLMSDGWLLKLVYRMAGKTKLPEEMFALCVFEEKAERGNDGLLKAVRQVAAQAGEALQEAGYTLDTEVIGQVLGFMDMKGMLRRMRKDQIVRPANREPLRTDENEWKARDKR